MTDHGRRDQRRPPGSPAGSRTGYGRRARAWTGRSRPTTCCSARSALLLTIGLIMVLSASSVYAYRTHDSSSYVVRQAADLGGDRRCPSPGVASRLPHGACCARSPGRRCSVAVVLLALTQTGLGVAVNGNRNWLALGPLPIQPSEIAKLALDPVGAPTSTPARSAASTTSQHVLIPVVPGGRRWSSAWSSSGTTSAPRWCCSRSCSGMLWVVGAPARLFVGSRSWSSAWSRSTSPPPTPSGCTRLTNFTDPFKRLPAAPAGSRPTACSRCRAAAVRPGHRRQPAEVGQPPRGAHRLHLRRARRGARPGRHPARARRCSSPSPTPRIRVARRHRGPVRPLHDRRASWSG